jgi:hypothetical protein
METWRAKAAPAGPLCLHERGVAGGMSTPNSQTDLITLLVGQHRAVDQLFVQLEKLDGSTDEQVRRHVDDEENDLFPKLREHCSQQQLAELGSKVEQAEKTAPTRPHPSSPSEGSSLAALAPGAGMVDRLRDALTGRAR